MLQWPFSSTAPSFWYCNLKAFRAPQAGKMSSVLLYHKKDSSTSLEMIVVLIWFGWLSEGHIEKLERYPFFSLSRWLPKLANVGRHSPSALHPCRPFWNLLHLLSRPDRPFYISQTYKIGSISRTNAPYPPPLQNNFPLR